MIGVMRSYDVIVVGGGVIGCAAAFALARSGASVVVVERDRVASHASSAAAGMLAPIVGSLEAGPTCSAGIRSLELFPSLVDEIGELSGIDPGFTRCGVLHVAFSDQVEALRERATDLADLGCEWLDRSSLLECEPRLSPEVEGGIWSPREAHVDSFLLTRALAGAAARRGAQFELGSEVVGLRCSGKRVLGVQTATGQVAAGEVVLCTGAWAQGAGRWLELALPVTPVKGQMIALELSNEVPSRIIWSGDIYLVPGSRGTLRVGATVERAGFDVRVTAAGLSTLLAGAQQLLPELGEARFREAWVGLYPCTPDHQPLVGPVPGFEGLTVAVGHCRNGILLSPATGLCVADWVLARERRPEFSRFDPERFLNAGTSAC